MGSYQHLGSWFVHWRRKGILKLISVWRCWFKGVLIPITTFVMNLKKTIGGPPCYAHCTISILFWESARLSQFLFFLFDSHCKKIANITQPHDNMYCTPWANFTICILSRTIFFVVVYFLPYTFHMKANFAFPYFTPLLLPPFCSFHTF